MAFLNTVLFGLVWFFNLFLGWLAIFAAPIKKPVMLWILGPIYINWIFTDFFQERRRTAIGNAITNGAVVLWVSIDWARTMIDSFEGFNLMIYIKFGFLLLIFVYGITIIIEGIRGKDFVTKLGRVRETSYLMLMATPFIYGALELNFLHILAAFVFFPVFYFTIELINHKVLPKLGIGKIEEEEKKLEEKGKEKELPEMGLPPKSPELPGMPPPRTPELGKEF